MRVVLFLSLLFCGSLLQAQSDQEKIRLNQVGYYPSAEKRAVITDLDATSFKVVDDSGNVALEGKVQKGDVWYADGDQVNIIDFSKASAPGTYRIKTDNGLISYRFEIGDESLLRSAKGALKYFYYNRSSTELDAEHAGRYARPLGHKDTEVIVHRTAASDGLAADTKISSPGGWYDAGDYGKYMSTAGISSYSLLLAYEHYADFLTELEWNIPESGNNVPDVLDEVVWELRWMFTMQDPTDGGVFHKLTTKNFSAMDSPDKVDHMQRFVCGRNTVVALDFAASMAAAHRVYKDFDEQFPGLADSCLTAATKAMDWAIANPEVKAVQCDEFVTGAYGDSSMKDEWTWAAVEMFIATKDEKYLSYAQDGDGNIEEASWQNVMALPYLSILTHKKSFSKQKAWLKKAESKIKQLSDSYVDYTKTKENPYGVVMGEDKHDWVWGSNGGAMNQSMILFTAYNYFEKDGYLKAAMTNVNYLLGLNPTGYSYLSGFGDKKLYYMHHRISVGDNIKEPVPGLVSGGPFLTNQNECPRYPDTKAPGKKFLDQVCSYSTNEMTVNWNAPTAYSMVAAQAIYGK